MRSKRTITGQFTTTAKWLHWLVAFFLLTVISAAWSFAFTAPAARAEAIPVHVGIGLIVLALTLIRLGWRAVAPPPPTPVTAPGWMHGASKWGHMLLYGLFLYQAVLGIWMAALSPVDIRFFNTWNLSALAPANPELLAALRPWHFVGACLLSLTIAGHVAAALWHHFALRDDVLIRMLPFSGLWQRMTTAHPRFPSTQFHNWPKRMPKRISS